MDVSDEQPRFHLTGSDKYFIASVDRGGDRPHAASVGTVTTGPGWPPAVAGARRVVGVGPREVRALPQPVAIRVTVMARAMSGRRRRLWGDVLIVITLCRGRA